MNRPESTVKFLENAAKYFELRPTNGDDSQHWANVYNAENCIKAAKMIVGFQEYIENLERWLEQAGYKKICSDCNLAGIPIWGNSKSECCEVCDEP